MRVPLCGSVICQGRKRMIEIRCSLIAAYVCLPLVSWFFPYFFANSFILQHLIKYSVQSAVVQSPLQADARRVSSRNNFYSSSIAPGMKLTLYFPTSTLKPTHLRQGLPEEGFFNLSLLRKLPRPALSNAAWRCHLQSKGSATSPSTSPCPG